LPAPTTALGGEPLAGAPAAVVSAPALAEEKGTVVPVEDLAPTPARFKARRVRSDGNPTSDADHFRQIFATYAAAVPHHEVDDFGQAVKFKTETNGRDLSPNRCRLLPF